MNRIVLEVLLFGSLFSIGCFENDTRSDAGSADLDPDRFEMNETGNIPFDYAQELLDLSPVSVIDKPGNSLINNPRTYLSLACYWWPDPDSKDGTPYIRKDGEVNPETRSDKSDLPKMIEMAQRVETLTNAYKMSGEEEFADKAIEQLLTWFVDDNTAMYPHLDHAQMVKGRNSGRSYGVIDTWWLIRVIESIPVLRYSDYWNIEIEQGLRAWFTHYLNWLRNSDFGQTEMQSKNNHGTWYDLQVVTFARFVDQNDFAIHHMEEITRSRIARQISLSGRQKYETRRPRPLHYSIYNLSGLMKLALHGNDLEVDLKTKSGFFSGTLEDALLYLVKSMDGIDPQILMDEFDQTDTDLLYLNLLRDGLQLFPRPEIKTELMRLTQVSYE
ncbi:hypothetical protein DYD21_01190 [Rhodohalobacter sp. SW132]|uniref:alginate lyase family protein n=1 Tax=Rhodohalobacter sp. SW132 TaxID=2293433 RepID=UPI000E2510C8|nr:alginate lyase family protein [Rhodohalobacter sp. SW132]REL38594.1 hypothetical protein DYD21_01190 [Rhodohalobacter sp. SW132]